MKAVILLPLALATSVGIYTHNEQKQHQNGKQSKPSEFSKREEYRRAEQRQTPCTTQESETTDNKSPYCAVTPDQATTEIPHGVKNADDQQAWSDSHPYLFTAAVATITAVVLSPLGYVLSRYIESRT